MARVETIVGSNALSASLAAGSGTLLIQLEEIGGFETFNSASTQTGNVIRPAGTDGRQPSEALRQPKTREYTVSSSFELSSPSGSRIVEKTTVTAVFPPVSASDLGFPVLVSPGVPFFNPSASFVPTSFEGVPGGFWKGEWITPGPTSSLNVPLNAAGLSVYAGPTEDAQGPTASFDGGTSSFNESPPVDNIVYRLTWEN